MKTPRYIVVVVVLVLLAGAALGAQHLAGVQDLLAQMEVARDLRRVTFRDVVPEDLTVCVQQKTGTFGQTRCYTVRDLRLGLK